MQVHCSRTQLLLSPGFWLSYTTPVWSGKSLSRSTHWHKLCLFHIEASGNEMADCYL